MPETPAFLAERLKTEGEKTAAFFESLADTQWQASVFSEGATWKVRNVLVHLVIAEKSIPSLLANIRDGVPGPPKDFNLDTYNAEQAQAAAALSSQELIAQFKTGRANVVAFVKTLSAADLEKRGRHPAMGLTTMADMLEGICIHNRIHIHDLSSIS